VDHNLLALRDVGFQSFDEDCTMIRLTNPFHGSVQYVHPQAIARVIEAGASSQWHGVRSIVKTFDGQTLECSETANEITAAIAKAQQT
jgi:hypothetical protein